MRHSRWVGLFVISVCVIALAGCGISKDKYNVLLDEKISLEEKVNALAKAKDALKNEYDNLLKEKMNIDIKLSVAANEKAALKAEYDKLLDEKISLKAAYDKLLGENKELQIRLRR